MRKISMSANKCTSKKRDTVSGVSKLKVSAKMKKTRNSKYKNQIERTDGKNERNRASYRRCALRKKVRAGISQVSENFDTVYRRRMFSGLRYKTYQVMVTLTNHDTVTIKKHDANVKRLLTWLTNLGYVKQYFQVNEDDDVNFHSHILMNLNVTIRSITGIIKKYWQDKYGFVDVLKIGGQDDKDRVIKYCLKQLKPTSGSNRKQDLIDTWELSPEIPVYVPEPDLFKNTGFLRSVRSQKNRRDTTLPKHIIFEPEPLQRSKGSTRKTRVSVNDQLGIY